MRINNEGYLELVRCRGRPSPKQTGKSIFLVKQTPKGEPYAFKTHSLLYLPKDVAGKRVRFKMEIVEENE